MSGLRQSSLNITGGVLAAALVALLAYCLYALVNVEVPTPNKDPLLVVIGILSGAVGTVTQFYFGSSIGHKKQAETIDVLAQTANTVAQTANPTPPAGRPPALAPRQRSDLIPLRLAHPKQDAAKVCAIPVTIDQGSLNAVAHRIIVKVGFL